MERLGGPIPVVASSVGNLPQDEAGSRNVSELAWISLSLHLGKKKVRGSKNKYGCYL